MSQKFKGDINIQRNLYLGSLTTAQRTSLVPTKDGSVVYDSDLDSPFIYTSGSWVRFQYNILSDGHILIGNGSNEPTAQTLSGDMSITNTGVATVKSRVKDWTASTDVLTGEIRNITIGGIDTVAKSDSDRTTLGTLTNAERAEWTYVSQITVPEFIASTFYLAGFKVIYEGRLYYKNVGGVSSGSFNSSNWTSLSANSSIGEWQASTQYYENDLVFYDRPSGGKMYLKALGNHTSETSMNTTEAPRWELVSQLGDAAFVSSGIRWTGMIMRESGIIIKATSTGQDTTQFRNVITSYEFVGQYEESLWAPFSPYYKDQIVSEDITGIPIRIRSTSTRSTTSFFNIAEFGNWGIISQDSVPDWNGGNQYIRGFKVTHKGMLLERLVDAISEANFNATEASRWKVLSDNRVNVIDASSAVQNVSIEAPAFIGQVQEYIIDDNSNAIFVAVEPGTSLNGVVDGTMRIDDYPNGTIFRATALSYTEWDFNPIKFASDTEEMDLAMITTGGTTYGSVTDIILASVANVGSSSVTLSGNQINLKAGKRYEIIADLQFNGISAGEYLEYAFVDSSNAVIANSKKGITGVDNYTASHAVCLIEPSVDTVVKVRIIDRNGSGSIRNDRSSVTVKELPKTSNVGNFYPVLNSATVEWTGNSNTMNTGVRLNFDTNTNIHRTGDRFSFSGQDLTVKAGGRVRLTVYHGTYFTTTGGICFMEWVLDGTSTQYAPAGSIAKNGRFFASNANRVDNLQNVLLEFTPDTDVVLNLRTSSASDSPRFDQNNGYIICEELEGSLVSRVEQYSATETKTNKYWIDGRPIYRRYIDLSSVANNANALPASSVDVLISQNGILYNGSGQGWPLPHPNDANSSTLIQNADGSVELARNGAFATPRSGDFVVIEYVK